VLFAANSMPVRDLDFYGGPCAAWLAANRGASGIDGNIASAAGWAAATGTCTQALVGDLAALHDLNSLALLRTLKTPFALIVLNNDGGGIFSFLPVAHSGAHFEAFFGTPHGLRFAHAAAQFGLRHVQADTPAEFRAALRHAQKQTGATIIEVSSDRAQNVAHHRALQAQLVHAVDKACS
jgi:2-succinyl-5-enolpyruvyl-6-hydroxy-3-cyclohexene-1-carboxylate synthase